MSSRTPAEQLTIDLSEALNCLALLVVPAGIAYARSLPWRETLELWVCRHLDAVIAFADVADARLDFPRAAATARALKDELLAGPLGDDRLATRVRTILEQTGFVSPQGWAEVERRPNTSADRPNRGTPKA